MLKLVTRFLSNEDGATAIEYGLNRGGHRRRDHHLSPAPAGLFVCREGEEPYGRPT
jgi:hypothetical protein